jgi:hypothetical protein
VNADGPGNVDVEVEELLCDEELARRLEAFRLQALKIVKAFRPYCVGLLPNTVAEVDGMPDTIGSGALIRSGSLLFVLTAAHVWRRLRVTDEVRVGNAVCKTHLIEPITYDENRDIATLRLPSDCDSSSIGATEYRFAEIGRAKRGIDAVALGFRFAGTKAYADERGQGLHVAAASLYTVPQEYEPAHLWLGSEAAAWTGFRLDETYSDLIADPDASGMSGGRFSNVWARRHSSSEFIWVGAAPMTFIAITSVRFGTCYPMGHFVLDTITNNVGTVD